MFFFVKTFLFFVFRNSEHSVHCFSVTSTSVDVDKNGVGGEMSQGEGRLVTVTQPWRVPSFLDDRVVQGKVGSNAECNNR